MPTEKVLNLVFRLSVLILLLIPVACHFLSYLPYRRKKDQEALLKASSKQQEGVWPPAPTTYALPEQEYPHDWVWCFQCQRVMHFTDFLYGEAICVYEDCAAPSECLLTWYSLIKEHSELPQTPERGIVYPDLVQLEEEPAQEGDTV